MAATPTPPSPLRRPGRPGLRFPRHLALIEPIWDHHVTIVTGPPGSGRSTFLDLVADEARRRSAVVRFEGRDLLPGELSHRVHVAVADTSAGVAPGGSPTIEREVGTMPGGDVPLTVVVDDVHHLEGTGGETELAELVAATVGRARWVVSGRWDLLTSQVAGRFDGEVHRIGPDALRLHPWEVEQLFARRYQQRIEPHEAAELTRRTEGWVTGIHLFHRATIDRPLAERQQSLRSLSSVPSIVEHLSREVLDDLPTPVRDFLVRTSPLGLFTGDLCDRLLDRDGSGPLIEELGSRLLFIVPLQRRRGWRVHRVLGDLLRQMLEREVGIDRAREQHRRAGRLLAAAGSTREASEAYLRAGALEEAVELLHADASAAGALDMWPPLPEATPSMPPALALAGARSHLGSGRLADAVDAYDDLLERGRTMPEVADAEREVAAVRSWLQPERSGPIGWVDDLRRAVGGRPHDVAATGGTKGEAGAAAIDTIVRALASIFGGNLERGGALLAEVAEGPGAAGPPVEDAAIEDATVEDAAVEVAAGSEGGRPGTGVVDPVLAGAASMLVAMVRSWVGVTNHTAVVVEAARVDRLGRPWLSELAHAVAVMADPLLPVDELEAIVTRRAAAGDPLGTVVARVFVSVSVLGHCTRTRDPGLDEDAERQAVAAAKAWTSGAAEQARILGVDTLEAWCRALHALLVVRDRDVGARQQALAAEQLARRAEVVVARALALGALAVAGGPTAEGQFAEAESLGRSIGVGGEALVRRLVAWADPAGRAVRGAGRLAGRSSERELLLRHAAPARAGRGGVVEVTGPPRAGTTALLRSVADDLRQDGWAVLFVELDDGAPTDGWHQVRAGWSVDPGAVGWTTGGPRLGQSIRSDVSDSKAGSGHGGAGPLLRGGARVIGARVEELTSLLDDVSSRSPTLAVVDRIDRAPLDLAATFAALGRSLGERPVLLVLGGRGCPHDLPVCQGSTRLDLRDLDEAGVAELLALLGEPADDACFARVWHLTGGRPDLVLDLSRAGGAERITSLPAGLRSALVDLEAELSGIELQLLAEMAVVGPVLRAPVLEDALGVDRRTLDRVLGAAADAGLLVEHREQPDALEFRSPALADHLAGRIDMSTRIDRMRSVGAAARRGGAPASERVTPALQALRMVPDSAAKALDDEPSMLADLHEAVADSIAAGRDDEALAHYELALEAFAAADGAIRADLHLRTARVNRRVGAGGPATAQLWFAVEVGEGDDFLTEVALEALVLAGEAHRPTAELVSLVEVVRRRLTSPHPVVEAWWSTWGEGSAVRDVDESSTVAAAGEAVAEAAAWGPSWEAIAERLRHDGLWAPELRDERLASARSAVVAATACGDLGLLRAAARLEYLDLLARAERVTPGAGLGLVVSARRGERSGPWWARVLTAASQVIDGRIGDVDRQVGADSRAAILDPDGLFPAELDLLVSVLDGSDVVDAATRLQHALGPSVTAQVLGAWTDARSGRHDAAAAVLDRVMAAGIDGVRHDCWTLPVLVWLGETALALDDVGACEILRGRLVRWAGSVVVIEPAGLVWGPVDRTLGLLAGRCGDDDAAIDSLRAAVDVADRLEAPPWQALSLVDLGAALVGRDRRGDRTEGRAVIAEGIDRGRGLGMAVLVRRGEELLRSTSSRPPSAPAPGLDLDSAGSEPARSPSVRVTEAPTPSVSVRCFGPFELLIHGAPADVASVRPKAREVLWFLACHAGRPVHRLLLVADLWPSADDSAGRRNLQVAVSSVRTALTEPREGGDWSLITRDGESYRLTVDADRSDVARFEAALAAARRAPAGSEDRAVALTAVLEEHRGDLLEEAGACEWVHALREQHRVIAADAACSLAQHALDAGQVDRALEACERGLAIDRYRDVLWNLLASVREVQGDGPAARRVRAARLEMLEDLGAVPDV